jgi:hypothetical protein
MKSPAPFLPSTVTGIVVPASQHSRQTSFMIAANLILAALVLFMIWDTSDGDRVPGRLRASRVSAKDRDCPVT